MMIRKLTNNKPRNEENDSNLGSLSPVQYIWESSKTWYFNVRLSPYTNIKAIILHVGSNANIWVPRKIEMLFHADSTRWVPACPLDFTQHVVGSIRKARSENKTTLFYVERMFDTISFCRMYCQQCCVHMKGYTHIPAWFRLPLEMISSESLMIPHEILHTHIFVLQICLHIVQSLSCLLESNGCKILRTRTSHQLMVPKFKIW